MKSSYEDIAKAEELVRNTEARIRLLVENGKKVHLYREV